jgi:hypothetical protein
MLSLAGTAASGIMDLLSALKQTDSGKNKPSATATSAFLPVTQSTSADTTSTSTTSTSSSSAVSTDTMRALLWMQSHGIDMSSSIMSALDTDNSGGVSKDEFEKIFAKNGDTTKADAAFAKLDTDGDGSVNAKELAAGLRSGRHHHHGPSDTASSDANGGTGSDTSQTVTNADGSTTTTINYSDGSQVTMTRPAANSDSSGALTNLLERLIQRQADMLTQTSSGQILAKAA